MAKRTRPDLRAALRKHCGRAAENLEWLQTHLHPYFFITMAEETEALVNLAAGLHLLAGSRRLVLSDREEKLILACPNRPGSVYESLRGLGERPVSYAEITHSYAPVPGAEWELEIHRFEFGLLPREAVAAAGAAVVPPGVRRSVARALRRLYPDYDMSELDRGLGLLWRNNEAYVRVSPPERVARCLWLYQQGRAHDGLYLDAEATEDVAHHQETRILFAVGNPSSHGFLAQALEVFHRLGIGVRRSYCLTITTGVHPYFLGTFYVITRNGEPVSKGSTLYERLKVELYNTQILSTAAHTYTHLVTRGVMTGEEASLTNALIAFCHTNLAHNRPDRFGLGAVRRAFDQDPEMALVFVRLFRLRFDPDLSDRGPAYDRALADAQAAVDGYNTGHRHLDELRRTVFRTALLLVRHTLKTNFYVPEKHALGFRLDPAYLQELGDEFVADLPQRRPFRVTFFFGRHGAGYHVGFSDIARGGWRTVLCRTDDDFHSNTSTLLREVYVLAHTQHLKNKDIYEGGSKMVVALGASDLSDPELVTQRLYKLQYGFLNAFLDLFVTRDGCAVHPRVVDYYGEDEPIELGPDENMHDAMIELMARQAEKRGYLLGKGIISSKKVGINHKEYGVTSLGVVTFAEITLAELGIDIRKDPFTVVLTGGPNGDVAGNALRLLLARCPRVRFRAVIAGSGALFDPAGIDRDELTRLVLRHNIDRFAVDRIHPGGFLLDARAPRQEGLRELYRKVLRTDAGVEEQWITADEFHREFDGLVFSVGGDLFLPAGGRPETIDDDNWSRLLGDDGSPRYRAVVEGANSYLTPNARAELERRGVLLMRDASANKCGVISSSYEILANLLMSDEEFLAVKDAYVEDVLRILERRAEDEARLLLARRRQSGGAQRCSEISMAVSTEINAHYGQLFDLFLARPDLVEKPVFRRVLLAHLPALVGREPRLRRRAGRLPRKIRCAVLAAELGGALVYRGGGEPDLASSVTAFARGRYGAR
ncbi:MAG: NAD-glutamate dehydrogenase [Deltaproteobacteria bacterium]|nr:NAD-glutamate dehydrogenase [Deltaproteobacteria bacterium]